MDNQELYQRCMATDMQAVLRTHAGKVREHNEDSALIDEHLGLCIVADGMGGHKFGAQCSKIAVERIQDYLKKTASHLMGSDDLTPDMALELLSDAFYSAHSAILDYSAEHAPGERSGTTCTALWHTGSFAVAGHIGDSFLFRLHDNRLEQVSTEHTMVQEMVNIGRLTPEQALESPYKNMLTKVMGYPKKYKPDFFQVDIIPDSFFLLCSDGLTKVVENDEIAAALNELAPESMDKAVDRLLDLSLKRGGPDNVSLVLVKANPAKNDTQR